MAVMYCAADELYDILWLALSYINVVYCPVLWDMNRWQERAVVIVVLCCIENM